MPRRDMPIDAFGAIADNLSFPCCARASRVTPRPLSHTMRQRRSASGCALLPPQRRAACR